WMGEYFAVPCWQPVRSTDLVDSVRARTLGILSGSNLDEVRRRALATRPPFERTPATPLRWGTLFIWLAQNLLGLERCWALYRLLQRPIKLVANVLEKIFGRSRFRFRKAANR